MTLFVITSILLTYYLIPFGNCVYLPSGRNQLSGSAGGGAIPSASSTIQNDLPSGQYIPKGRNQLSGSAGGTIPPASSTIQNIDNPRNLQPNYRKGTLGSDTGYLPYPNKYAVNPSYPGRAYPSITVNSVNNAVSTSSSQPSADQIADDENSLDDF